MSKGPGLQTTTLLYWKTGRNVAKLSIMLKELVEKNRSRRRFVGDYAVSRRTLESLVELARLSASSANLQPLKYILSFEKEKNDLIFPHLRWAGYLRDWPGPSREERPSAYIIIVGDTAISESFAVDAGIAAQSIMLGAVEKGLGGCIISSINREGLREALGIPDRFEILLALALGKPAEEVVIEELPPDGDVKYWRSPDGVHHVPKRGLQELILKL